MEHTALLSLTDVADNLYAGLAVLPPRLLTGGLQQVSKPLRDRGVPQRGRFGVHAAPQTARAPVSSLRAPQRIPRQHRCPRGRERHQTSLAVPRRKVRSKALGLVAQIDRCVARTVTPLAARPAP